MIRVGLIGFGMAGRVFHGPLISSVDGLELATVLERSSDNAVKRYPRITTYRSLDAILADSSLDLFVVATPSGTHFDVARQVIEAGKNVLVDKPVATTSAQIAELIQLAAGKNSLLVPFHNRRWDSDFLTIQKLLHEGPLGRIVYLESRFDRWRPKPPSDRLWKEDPTEGGGALLDLGTHIADQALQLFGLPEAIFADVLCERDWARANDAFQLRLRYPGFTVALGANSLSMPARPRFHIRGARGNFWKWGLDPQEAALNQVVRIADPGWGREPPENWGTLNVDVEGGSVSRPVAPILGDYRLYYAAVRDAVLGKAAPPVAAIDAWRVARLLEWALDSSNQRREIECDWNNQPQ
jgi:predicted dehydrogenase